MDELRSKVAQMLNYPSASLSLCASPSEEAKVWSVQHVESEPIAWIKRHHSSEKASREVKALRDWGPILNAPSVLGQPDERTLLLSHVQGNPLSDMRDLHRVSADALGVQLARLHSAPSIDSDSLTLAQALSLRIQSGLKTIELLLNDREGHASFLQLNDLHIEGVMRIKDLFQGGVFSPETSEGIISLQRVPCHRDLHVENVLTSGCHESQRFTLSVIDWGQSRADWWAADWSSIWVNWRQHPVWRQQVWERYWNYRNNLGNLSQSDANRSLYIALSLRCLGTFRWILNPHRDKRAQREVGQRGIFELEELFRLPTE